MKKSEIRKLLKDNPDIVEEVVSIIVNAMEKPSETDIAIKDLAIGEGFEYCGRTWVRLGEEQDGILCITADFIADDQEFGEDAEYATSKIKGVLEAFTDELNKDDLLPYVMDLTSDNGDDTLTEYKADGAGLISCGLYRKYYKYIPRYKSWWWTCTPWCFSTLAGHVRRVPSSGVLSGSYARSASGVVPVCILKPMTLIRHDRGEKVKENRDEQE